MKQWQLFLGGFIGFAIALSIPVLHPSPSSAQNSSADFYCGKLNGIFVVAAKNKNGPIPFISFQRATNFATPLERCKIVARRFHEAHRSETLGNLTHGKVNGQPVICAPQGANTSCNQDNILVTLVFAKPEPALDKIRSLMGPNARRTGPIQESGQENNTPQFLDSDEMNNEVNPDIVPVPD